MGCHGLGDSLAVAAGGANVVLNGDHGVAHTGDGVGPVNCVVAKYGDVAVGSIGGENAVERDTVDIDKSPADGDNGVGVQVGAVDSGHRHVIGIDNALVDFGCGDGGGEFVAVAVEGDGVPITAIDAVNAFGFGNAALVGDDCTHRYVAAAHGRGVAHDAFVQDAHGVVGGNLLGYAVDGTAAAVKIAHVDGVDGVSWIGGLQGVDIGTVPFSGGVAVDHGRETGLQNKVVDKRVVAIGAGILFVVFGLAGEIRAVVLAGERDGGLVILAVENACIRAERVDVAGTGGVISPAAVAFGHDGEYKTVLLAHVGIEVNVAGTAVISVGGQDMGFSLSKQAAQSLEGLASAQ